MTRRVLSTFSTYRGPIRLAAVTLLLLALLTYGWLYLTRFFEVKEVSLPDVVGMSEAEATRVLSGLGLEVLAFGDSIASVASGAVTSQSPSAGTVVREGRGISIGVNEPQANTSVPDLLSLSVTEASTNLDELGLGLGEVRYVFNEAAENAVLTQLPEAGTTLAAGSKVDLVVSRGPNIRTVTMPEVRGMSVDAAKRRLTSLGFSAIDTTASSVSFDKPLNVTDQLPLSGQAVPVTARVSLYYTLSTNTVIQVPYLTGLSLGRARQLLRGNRLTLGAITYITDPGQPGGVVQYEPSGYTINGSPVSLTLNTSGAPLDPPEGFADTGPPLMPGRPGSAFSPSPRPNPDGTFPSTVPDGTTQTPSSVPDPAFVDGQRNVPFDFDPARLGMPSLTERAYTLELRVIDDRGERTVFEDVISAGNPVHLDVTIYGEATLQTYVNDILFLAWNP